jgi:glycosyltransferase involved in cell wall biosynthesis
MNRVNIKIVSIFPEKTALWTYGHFLHKYLSQNRQYDVEFVDLWKNKEYHSDIRRAFALLNGITIEDCDVLILVAPLLSKSLKKTHAKLKIVIAHDLYPLQKGNHASFPVKSLVKATYKHMKEADIILPVSEFCKSEILEFYGLREKMIKINGGIDHTKFKSLKNKKQNKIQTVLHVGRDDPRKNFRFVLELLKRIKGAKLLKIGTISKNDATFIQKNNLDVEIIRNVDDAGLVRAYSTADMLIFPSTYEGLGLPPIEAMACGCPVIAGNNTGLQEVCIKESLTPLNVDAWERKAEKILHDKNYRSSMIKKGLQQAKKFDWKRYAAMVDAVIKKNLQR